MTCTHDTSVCAGPSKKVQEAGFWSATVSARSQAAAGEQPVLVKAHIAVSISMLATSADLLGYAYRIAHARAAAVYPNTWLAISVTLLSSYLFVVRVSSHCAA